MLFTKVSLPPFDKYYLFHIVSHLRNLSSITSQTCEDLKETPDGKPK